MKCIVALLALCALGTAFQASAEEKTKYICSFGGLTTVEFDTKEECFKACLQPGIAAVCQKTSIETDIEDSEEDIY